VCSSRFPNYESEILTTKQLKRAPHNEIEMRTTKARRTRRNTKKVNEEVDVALLRVTMQGWRDHATRAEKIIIVRFSFFFVPLRVLRAFGVRFTN